MNEIFSRVKFKKKYFVWLFVFLIIAIVGETALPTIMAEMLEQGVVNKQTNNIYLLAGGMAFGVLMAFVGNMLVAKISSRIATLFARDVRKELFNKVQSFSGQELDKFGTASLITRTTSDVTNLQSFLSAGLQIGMLAPLMMVAGVILVSVTGGETSSVLIFTLPVLLLGMTVVLALAVRYSKSLRQSLDKINRIFLEILQGVRVIRAFNKQETEKNRFAETNSQYAIISLKNNRLMGGMMPFIQVIFGLTTIGVMGVGADAVAKGKITVSALVANSQYVALILGAIVMAAYIISFFPTAFASMSRIGEVLGAEVKITDGAGVQIATEAEGTVTFKDVTFSYADASEPVLKDISFTSKPGEVTAIIGATGSGKSSVLKLIPRLYDITFGEIKVNGRNIKDYKLQELRDIIGYVPQKNVLFSGDIASNLNFGQKDGTASDWARAAEIAAASEFIEDKPGKYQAEIAQGGTNLSGG
ncbi:ABC transporter ATP-binding protein, partial [Streptococcus merionis]|uniref:ABC transporter ATP-binding protein n=1 Tax=Streptococcus merionis TaxID=400065 RepID=UPI0026EC9A38